MPVAEIEMQMVRAEMKDLRYLRSVEIGHSKVQWRHPKDFLGDRDANRRAALIVLRRIGQFTIGSTGVQQRHLGNSLWIVIRTAGRSRSFSAVKFRTQRAVESRTARSREIG